MARNTNRIIRESAKFTMATYNQYLERLKELAMTVFKWENLPPSIDERFLELSLYQDGMAVFFYDEVMGHLCLQCMIGGRLDVYRIPIERTAYATNGYQRKLNKDNSVIIFNNYLHTNSVNGTQLFSNRLYRIDRTIDINVNAQKTPLILMANENQKLSIKNLFQKYDGDEPFIFANKGLDKDCLKAIKTDAPFIADELYKLKTEYWNEALTYLGIPNVGVQKKERMIQEEVSRTLGGAIASGYSKLKSRQDACKKINEMFGLNISVSYNDAINPELKNENEEGEDYE